jgi:hypothetical protein
MKYIMEMPVNYTLSGPERLFFFLIRQHSGRVSGKRLAIRPSR